MPGPRSILRRLAVLAGLAIACAGRGDRRDALGPPELLVEVLPPSAEVSLDGRPLGTGPRAVPAPAPGEHVLHVSAPGYEPVDEQLPPQSLAGTRFAAALRPEGFGSGRTLDYDEADGLALAAAFLVRAGRGADAAAYAERARVLDPGLPLAHRALGDARASLGDLDRAVASWVEYLRLAPDASDADSVGRRIAAVRGDVTLPAR